MAANDNTTTPHTRRAMAVFKSLTISPQPKCERVSISLVRQRGPHMIPIRPTRRIPEKNSHQLLL